MQGRVGAGRADKVDPHIPLIADVTDLAADDVIRAIGGNGNGIDAANAIRRSYCRGRYRRGQIAFLQGAGEACRRASIRDRAVQQIKGHAVKAFGVEPCRSIRGGAGKRLHAQRHNLSRGNSVTHLISPMLRVRGKGGPS